MHGTFLIKIFNIQPITEELLLNVTFPVTLFQTYSKVSNHEKLPSVMNHVYLLHDIVAGNLSQ